MNSFFNGINSNHTLRISYPLGVYKQMSQLDKCSEKSRFNKISTFKYGFQFAWSESCLLIWQLPKRQSNTCSEELEKCCGPCARPIAFSELDTSCFFVLEKAETSSEFTKGNGKSEVKEKLDKNIPFW